MSDRTARIRALNDELRVNGRGGQILVTDGMLARGEAWMLQAIGAIRNQASFDASNDPYGEQDFGSVDVGDEVVFWKIDYYDQAHQASSEDPSDPTITARVLTIMLASEY